MIEHNDRLNFKLNHVGERVEVFLSGVIDEDAKFDSIGTLKGDIIFNFKGITSINSIGIRNWINFIKQIKGNTYLVEVPPVIVRQINMIPSFLGNSKVMSVFLPYVCDECGHEKMELVKREHFFDSSLDLDAVVKCEKCNQEEMAFDGTPEQYFAFAK